jgi:hypothetical protein
MRWVRERVDRVRLGPSAPTEQHEAIELLADFTQESREGEGLRVRVDAIVNGGIPCERSIEIDTQAGARCHNVPGLICDASSPRRPVR